MAFNVREIFKALADAKADYVLVGGLAVILHGHLRATRDIDLVVGPGTGQLPGCAGGAVRHRPAPAPARDARRLRR